ncbi:hypothetical protein TUZN_1358 [Thermoproteus uzoniensis 768-20]|uniref:Uncharacterized protein n=1 Tax=Thermoproteus uzoniensis (strain 768-20) TaxID=999630 RepID=F2L198_THEU7|nr:hypothetical protein [Thermoproteus uzoniensis]AEA12834.1 hypothetical protein TUZN_1358 [Thermoproteus uzoniensis 768-20]
MERLLAGELEHLTELLKLRGAVEDEYMAAFLDGIIREIHLRVRLLEALDIPDLPHDGERLDVNEVVTRLNEMCERYEAHMALMKSLRASAKTQLELEVVAAMEKSIERTHLMLRMLINALTEFSKTAKSSP